ncbi:dynein light intermediate chain [Zygosaccharomyces mellis]|uniref:Dynein light intermediate chain n=1 Tax=Zygosaccharomyces mellis TaxID=42258 RepID=A0A4C2E0I2_9SACH|nr:dynein light intermediate chain [Zygosaccharomyces mellis]
MPDSWTRLLEESDKNETTWKRITVICAPTIETLRCFEKTFLPPGCILSNHSMYSIGFGFNSVHDGIMGNRLTNCELYSVLFPLQEASLECLKSFVDLKSTAIKWWFLLDWRLDDQKFWLSNLIRSLEVLRVANSNLTAGSVTICCLNTDQIYTKQKSTTTWNSNHVEFLQQSLRSFAFLERCSLVYSDPNDSTRSGTLLFGQLLADNYREIQADFVSATKILVPYGSDTPGLIKALDESFEPLQVLEQGFITQKFEKFIPGEKLEADEDKEKEDINDENIQSDLDHTYNVDVQQELSNLYEKSKQQFTINNT